MSVYLLDQLMSVCSRKIFLCVAKSCYVNTSSLTLKQYVSLHAPPPLSIFSLLLSLSLSLSLLPQLSLSLSFESCPLSLLSSQHTSCLDKNPKPSQLGSLLTTWNSYPLFLPHKYLSLHVRMYSRQSPLPPSQIPLSPHRV